jgi:signal transduction histidine kinase
MNSEEIVLAIISTTLLIFLLVAIIAIAFFISARQRLKQEMELAQTKLNFEKELRQVETEVTEQILSQFAQELHDNIGHIHTAMHYQIENQKIDNPQLADNFKPIEIYLSEATQQLRLLSRTLNNDYLGHIGLLSAMQLEIDRLKSLKRFEVHWQSVSGKSNLDKNQELMVFRIFQEIIQNALRHSAAKNLFISVNNRDDNFELSVKDDGRGFEFENMLISQKASGLRNILKRAKLAGMDVTVSSSPGTGSLFILKKLPILA